MIINYNFYDKNNLKINRNNDKGNLIRTYCSTASDFRPNRIRTADSRTKRSRKFSVTNGNARRYLYGVCAIGETNTWRIDSDVLSYYA